MPHRALPGAQHVGKAHVARPVGRSAQATLSRGLSGTGQKTPMATWSKQIRRVFDRTSFCWMTAVDRYCLRGAEQRLRAWCTSCPGRALFLTNFGRPTLFRFAAMRLFVSRPERLLDQQLRRRRRYPFPAFAGERQP